jgi:hypothetical protein
LHEKASRFFGTWPVALEYAGVRLIRGSSQNSSPEMVLTRLRRRCSYLHSMRTSYVRKVDYRLYREAVTIFGNWHNALAKAGIEKDLLYLGPKNPRLTREAALGMLAQRVLTGDLPTLETIACENQYLARCLIARFGSFRTALDLAMAHAAPDSGQHVS